MRARFLCLALLTACAPVQPVPQVAPPVSVAAPRPHSEPALKSFSLHDYKKGVATRIVKASADTYSAPMPEMMKSIVVLEITIDLLGQPTAVSVYRSNGYRRLEQRALASVAKGAPYPLPSPDLVQGRGSLTFLETFLFRDDDYFQVRSLVAPGWKPANHEALF